LTTLQTQVNNILSNTDAVALNSLSEIVTAFQDADTGLDGAITSLAGSKADATRVAELEQIVADLHAAVYGNSA